MLIGAAAIFQLTASKQLPGVPTTKDLKMS